MLTMYINVINRALVGSDILTHGVLQVPNFKKLTWKENVKTLTKTLAAGMTRGSCLVIVTSTEQTRVNVSCKSRFVCQLF